MLRFFINLNRSVKRRENIRKRLKELDLDFERCEAVDAVTLSDEFCQNIQYGRNDVNIRSRYTRQLTPAEIGCFLSHRECWKRLIQSDEEYAAVLEDALLISDRAATYLKDTKWLPEKIGICRLSCYEPGEIHVISRDQIKINEDLRLIIQLKPKPLGTQGYIISKKAAELALSLSEKLPCPVDDFLFTPLFEMSRHFPAWQIDPCIITRDFAQNSVIGSRSKGNIKALKANFFIRHGLKRLLLKARIKRIVKKGERSVLNFK